MSVVIRWNGMVIEAEVYRGTTPAGGDDPASVESLEVIDVYDTKELSAYLVDALMEDPGFLDELWDAADDEE